MNKSVLLKACNLRKQFSGEAGKVEVLKGVDLSISPGESVSIRGESGSGKTTLLNVLSCLEEAEADVLEWEGEDVLKPSPSKIAKRRAALIGFVFQAFYLVPELNVIENVRLAARIAGSLRRLSRDPARQLLERVGLSARERHLPSQLSGGEQQRVAVARALMNASKLILADEPTGNLDEKTGSQMMDLLLELCREAQTSLLLVTHNPEFAARTDRELILKQGRLAPMGTVAEKSRCVPEIT